jgi:L-fucose mutarotase/ribose pyranase (RbsD/FucU family)
MAHNNYGVSNLPGHKMSTELAQKSTNGHRKAQKGTERHKYKEQRILAVEKAYFYQHFLCAYSVLFSLVSSCYCVRALSVCVHYYY